MRGKKGFYAEYRSRLSDRSEVTADTEKELEMLEELFKGNEVHDVLDAGGGEGRLAIPLAEKGYSVTNIDSSEELIENMKKKTDKVSGVAGDLRELPFQDKKFDAVTFNWHVFCDILGNKGKRRVLDEANRVLRDKGVVALDIPDRASYEVVYKLLKEHNPALFKDRKLAREKMLELEDDFRQEKDPIAKNIYLQGRNALAYILDEELLFEPDPEFLGSDQEDGERRETVEVEKIEFKKDGIYLNYPGGENIFIGYVPSIEEVKMFLEEAGFKDIEAKQWKTRMGFFKVTFMAKKG